MAAVSVGIVGGVPMLDLNYSEDSTADVDFNLVMTDKGEFVEIQGTAERNPFGDSALSELLKLGRAGIARSYRTTATGRFTVKRLVVASTNAGKIREVSLALSDLPDWSVESLPDLPEIEETGTTFLENATLKASHYSRFIADLTLADDSGLCVEAIGGRPGLHSARYAPSTDERNDKLLAELAALGETADRDRIVLLCVRCRARRHGDLDRRD